MSFSPTMWEQIEVKAELLGYNENQFVEKCVAAILEMINTNEKRTVPKIVSMADAAKDFINIPIHLGDNIAQQVNGVEGNFAKEQDEEEAAA